jgi:hypothetical protein
MRAAPKTVQEITAVKPKLMSGLGVEGNGKACLPEVAVLENEGIWAVVVASVAVAFSKVVWAAGAAGPDPEKSGIERSRNAAVVPKATMKVTISVILST